VVWFKFFIDLRALSSRALSREAEQRETRPVDSRKIYTVHVNGRTGGSRAHELTHVVIGALVQKVYV